MRQSFIILCFFLALSALSACGGGGGGGSSPETDTSCVIGSSKLGECKI